MTPEGKFKQALMAELRELFPGCVVLKNDSAFQQGVPDWIVLFQDRWAMLEVKAYEKAKKQPNQDYYIEQLDEMSFAAFVYPENVEEVLHALQRHFQRSLKSSRSARVPVR